MAIKFIESGSAVILTLIENRLFKEGCTFTNLQYEASLEKIKKACEQINKFSKTGLFYFLSVEDSNIDRVASIYPWIVKVGERKYKGQLVKKFKLLNIENPIHDSVPYRLGSEHELKAHFKMRYGKDLYNELFYKRNEFNR